MNKIALYPGTFDPITNGHVDVIERAAKLFDQVIVAVADSTSKNTLFSTQERILLAETAMESIKNLKVIAFNRLMVDCAKQHGATVIIRGLRSVSDFEYELQLANMNRNLFSQAETIFLTPGETLSCISSSLVREIAKLDGDVSDFVPDNVLSALSEKLK